MECGSRSLGVLAGTADALRSKRPVTSSVCVRFTDVKFEQEVASRRVLASDQQAVEPLPACLAGRDRQRSQMLPRGGTRGPADRLMSAFIEKRSPVAGDADDRDVAKAQVGGECRGQRRRSPGADCPPWLSSWRSVSPLGMATVSP
jgi:hypothetical protein